MVIISGVPIFRIFTVFVHGLGIAYTSMFSTIFMKRNIFCYFLFATLANKICPTKPAQKESIHIKERICFKANRYFFKELTFVENGGKTEMTELLPLKGEQLCHFQFCFTCQWKSVLKGKIIQGANSFLQVLIACWKDFFIQGCKQE